jgi:hypothetical protein
VASVFDGCVTLVAAVLAIICLSIIGTLIWWVVEALL